MLLHSHRVGVEAVLVVVVACVCGMGPLSSRKRACVRACICGCMRQGIKYSDAFRSRFGTTSVVLAGGRTLGRHTIYSHAHTRTATPLNEHLGWRCGVGVMVIKYETENDFLHSKQLSILACFCTDPGPPGCTLRDGPSLAAAEIRAT